MGKEWYINGWGRDNMEYWLPARAGCQCSILYTTRTDCEMSSSEQDRSVSLLTKTENTGKSEISKRVGDIREEMCNHHDFLSNDDASALGQTEEWGGGGDESLLPWIIR
jgi:hypothetical protein